MKYALVLITHGDAPWLYPTLKAFAELVDPRPAVRIAVVDGASASHPPITPLGAWLGHVHGEQLGFCAAAKSGWDAAVESDCEYVFWLENDFLVQRRIDLAALAFELDRDHSLAQMSLMRNAVNEAERRAGGIFDLIRPEFEARLSIATAGPWLSHRAYFTTNPSLMRRTFMAENPWPDYPTECEGQFGMDLVERGYHFGVWGDGTPWVEHVGVRTGEGY